MKKFTSLALLGGATLALAACGSSEDASTEATADSVEIPTETALEDVTDEPVEDTAANEGPPQGDSAEDVAPPARVTQEAAEAAAENAESVAERAEAAAAAADAAAAAAAAVEE